MKVTFKITFSIFILTSLPYFRLLQMRAAQGVNLSYRLQIVLYDELREKQKVNPGGSSQQIGSPELINVHKSSNNISVRRSSRNKVETDSLCSDDNSRCSLPMNVPDQQPGLNVPEDSFGSIRGTRDPFNEVPTALNSNLYTMLRNNKSQRRSLLNGLISLFDDSQVRVCNIYIYMTILSSFPNVCT